MAAFGCRDRFCPSEHAPAASHLDVFRGTGADVLDLTVDPPPGWETWVIPGDYHPTPKAHERAARLIAARLETDPGLRDAQ